MLSWLADPAWAGSGGRVLRGLRGRRSLIAGAEGGCGASRLLLGRLRRFGKLQQACHLFLTELTPGTGVEPLQFQVAVGDARQFAHRVPYGIHHATHLAIAALEESDVQNSTLGGGVVLDKREVGGGGLAVRQLDPFREADRLLAPHKALRADAVDLGNVVAGMGETVGELAVVGEEQEARGIGVQAAYREDALLYLGNQFQYGMLRMGITDRAHVADRFVQHDVDGFGWGDGDGLAVYAERIGLRVDPGSEFADGLAVDLDPTLRYQGLAGAPRGDSGGGEHLL